MSKYLIFRTTDGTPLGVFSETDSKWVPEATAANKNYAARVIKNTSRPMPWEEKVRRLASSSPYSYMWTSYDSSERSLDKVLIEFQSQIGR